MGRHSNEYNVSEFTCDKMRLINSTKERKALQSVCLGLKITIELSKDVVLFFS